MTKVCLLQFKENVKKKRCLSAGNLQNVFVTVPINKFCFAFLV